MNIKRVVLNDLDQLTRLFGRYMDFYGQVKDPSKHREFLSERIKNKESTIFIAVDKDGTGMGFTQVYPSFTSVGLGRILVLNDLFVHADYRRKGVGRALIDAVKELAAEVGAIRLDLETGVDNITAQRLYENYGFEKSKGYYYYSYTM